MNLQLCFINNSESEEDEEEDKEKKEVSNDLSFVALQILEWNKLISNILLIYKTKCFMVLYFIVYFTVEQTLWETDSPGTAASQHCIKQQNQIWWV